MAILVWNNGGSGPQWSTPLNWVGGVSPTTSDTVQFDATSTADSHADISVAGVDIQVGYTGTITATSQGISLGVFSISDGEFDGSTGSLDINMKSFTQSGGIFTSTNGKLVFSTIASVWTKTGGAFNHNSGSIRVIGNQFKSFNNSAVEVFYTFEIALGAFDVEVLTNKLQIENRLIIDNSALSSSPALAGTIELIGTATLEQNGNLYKNTDGYILFTGGDHEWLQNNPNSVANMCGIEVDCTDLKLLPLLSSNSFGSKDWIWKSGTITNSELVHFRNNDVQEDRFSLYQKLVVGKLSINPGNFDFYLTDELGTGSAILQVLGDMYVNSVSGGTAFLGVGSVLEIGGEYSQLGSGSASKGEVKLLFNGTGFQVISTNSVSIPTPLIEINKPSGSIEILGDINQGRSGDGFNHISGSLQLHAGEFNIDGSCVFADTVEDLEEVVMTVGSIDISNTDMVGFGPAWKLKVTGGVGSAKMTGGTISNCDNLTLGGEDLFAFTSTDSPIAGPNIGVLFSNTRPRYINSASLAGGTGRTNEILGVNRAYASPPEWEAVEQSDLVVLGIKHHVLLSGVSEMLPLLIFGWTTSQDFYITLEAHPTDTSGRNYSRVWSDNHARIVASTAVSALFLSAAPYTQLKYLQFQSTPNSISNSGICSMSNSDGALWDGCKMRKDPSDPNDGGGLNIGGGDSVCIKNCLVDGSNSMSSIGLISAGSLTNASIANCMITGFNSPVFFSFPAAPLFTNVLIYDNSGTFSSSIDPASDHNSSDKSSPSIGINSRINQTFTFVDAAGHDFGLAASDEGALDFGVDLSARLICPVLFDNINTPRPQGSSYDIGAFETLPAALPPTIGFNTRTRRGLGIGLGLPRRPN